MAETSKIKTLISHSCDEQKKCCYDFLTYELTQIVNKSTHVPNTADHHAILLGFVLTSCPVQCFAEVLLLLGISDYTLIHVKIDVKPKASTDEPFHWTIYQYTEAN